MRDATRGEGAAKLVITLAAIGIVVFLGYKFIPVKFAHSQFEDCIIEEEKFAGEPRKNADIIRDNIWECARNFDLDAYFDKGAIKVTKTSNRVSVQIYYEREVVLPGYTYNWKFDHSSKRELY